MIKHKPKVLIADVDGVMTNGQFIYSKSGKIQKIFGPDDHDMLSILQNYLEIRFITGDKKGFKISKRRIVDDMSFKLDLVSTIKRLDWIQKKYDLKEVIYIGDGILDAIVMKKVLYSICPANGHELAKKHSNYVTHRSGGDRAVAEACLQIMKKYFKKFDKNNLPKKNKLSGNWKA